MARPGPKKKHSTKLDRLKEKEDVKLLVFAGHSLADAARMRGVDLSAVKYWSAEGKWAEELKRIQSLAKANSPELTGPANVAFDLALTNRQSRAALAQIANMTAMKTLETVTEKPGSIAVEDASDFLTLVKATAQVAGDWQDQPQGNKYAISINLAQMARDPNMVRDLAPEEIELYGINSEKIGMEQPPG
jgi:hypothetical protein